MGKAEHTVSELVGMIERRELRLPEMQREYVWTSTRVRDLLDSLYRDYPSGVILTWRTDEEVTYNDFAIETHDRSAVRPLLLLDGQQRLTSLSAVLRGEPINVRNRKRPVEILFNLEHPDTLTLVTEVFEDAGDDEGDFDGTTDAQDRDLMARFAQRAFVVSNKRLEALPHWIKVSDVFLSDSDATILQAAGLTGFNDPNFEKYSTRLKKLRSIREYAYRVDVLEPSMSYEEVTEIFVRVNSLGAKLRSSDLALAQITAKWRNSLKEFQAFQTECDAQRFRLDIGTHLRALVTMATGQSRFHTVSGISADTLQKSWTRSKKAIQFTISFFESDLRIDNSALLSSPFILVAIAYWADLRRYQIDPYESVQMRKWALLSNAKGRYSRGSSETILDQDLAVLRDGGGPEQLMEKLKQQVGRLEVTPEDLVGKTARSGLFKTMFLAFREQGARDWSSNLPISLNHGGQADRIEYHHVFPKAFMRGARPDLRPSSIDDLANLAFIGASTNKAIMAKAPAVYLPAYSAEHFHAQAIPTDPANLSGDAFEDFKTSRRLLIAERLNEFLSADPAAAGE